VRASGGEDGGGGGEWQAAVSKTDAAVRDSDLRRPVHDETGSRPRARGLLVTYSSRRLRASRTADAMVVAGAAGDGECGSGGCCGTASSRLVRR
jgi:hypothetical protein